MSTLRCCGFAVHFQLLWRVATLQSSIT